MPDSPPPSRASRPADRPSPSLGAGWFESSFDLGRGLDVFEEWPDPASPISEGHRHPSARLTAAPRSSTAIA